MTTELMSESRARAVRRLMLGTLGIAVVLVVIGAVLIGDADHRGYAVLVLGIAAVLAASSGLTLRALPGRGLTARRGSVVTGVLLLLCSVPLVGIAVGLATAVAGMGVLFVTLAKEPTT